jgi:hypothetical protein
MDRAIVNYLNSTQAETLAEDLEQMLVKTIQVPEVDLPPTPEADIVTVDHTAIANHHKAANQLDLVATDLRNALTTIRQIKFSQFEAANEPDLVNEIKELMVKLSTRIEAKL